MNTDNESGRSFESGANPKDVILPEPDWHRDYPTAAEREDMRRKDPLLEQPEKAGRNQ